MIRHFVMLFALGLAGHLLAQDHWRLAFDTLQNYETSDDVKLATSIQLRQELVEYLKSEPNFCPDDMPLHKVVSKDSSLFIYTWHYTFQDARSAYGGVLVHHQDVFPLRYSLGCIEVDKEYDASHWGGGVYYDVIPHYASSDTVFTLLAWDGNNGVSYKKIIDILSFDRKGQPIFGGALFEGQGRKVLRYILEYSSEMSLLLSYDQAQECIVTNALHSNDQRFSDVQAYYSATDDFNVFRFEKGEWVFYRDVDLRMTARESKKYQDPVKKNSGL